MSVSEPQDNRNTIEAVHDADRRLPQARAITVRKHLQAIQESAPFKGSKRSQQFLTLVIDHALNGRFDAISERMLGVEMFGRPIAYDTANDPVVRVKASEVRKKLAQYYHETPGPHAVRIELPLGSYTPRFYFAMPHPIEMPVNTSIDDPAKPNVEEGSLSLTLLKRGALLFVVVSIAIWQLYEHKSNTKVGDINHDSKRLFQSNLAGRPLVLGVGTFESNGQGADTLASGLRLDLIDALAELPRTRILSGTSTHALNINEQFVQESASLGINVALFGNLKLNAGTFHLRLDLLRGDDATQLASFNYSGNMEEMVNLQEGIRRDVFAELQLAGPQSRGAGNTTVNPKAYQQYLLGRFHFSQFTKPSILEAAEDYQEAIQSDPSYARPWCQLALVYLTLEIRKFEPADVAFARAAGAVDQALRLNPNLAEAHYALGNLLWRRDWFAAKAESEFKKAIEIGPDRSNNHRELANLYAETGRPGDATKQLEIARQLGPNNPALDFTNLYIATLAQDCSRVQEAVLKLQKAMVGSSFALNQEATGLWYCDRDRDAIQTWRNMAVSDNDKSRMELEDRGLAAWLKGGRRSYAELRLEAIRRGEASPLHPNDFIREEWAAMAGNDHEAVALIRKRFKDHDSQFLSDMSNPALTVVFENPDLQAFVAQVVK